MLLLKLYRCSPSSSSSLLVIAYRLALSAPLPALNVLGLLLQYRSALDASLSLRYSCREGICGSCALALNGSNALACLSFHTASDGALHADTRLHTAPPRGRLLQLRSLAVAPLLHHAVLHDLVVDWLLLYASFSAVRPWLISSFSTASSHSYSAASRCSRSLLEAHYECILCACCNASCPSYWWHAGAYAGPAILLQSLRWLLSYSSASSSIALLHKAQLAKCHSILACSFACPKGLMPAYAIVALQLLSS